MNARARASPPLHRICSAQQGVVDGRPGVHTELSAAASRAAMFAELQGVIPEPAPVADSGTAGARSGAARHVDAAAMKESIARELREAIADARAGAPPPEQQLIARPSVESLDQIVHALKAYHSMQVQTLQPALQTATEAAAVFNERFSHLAALLPPQLAGGPSFPAAVSTSALTSPPATAPTLLSMCPPVSSGGAAATSTSAPSDGVACQQRKAATDASEAAPATCGYNTCGSDVNDAS